MKKTGLNKKFYRKLLSLLLLALFLCSTVESRPFYQQTNQIRKSKKTKKKVVKKVVNKTKSTKVAEGSWGGIGIGFVVGNGGVQIEYDCAVGAINQTLVIDASGNFNVEGLYKRETPVLRTDLKIEPQPATFQGKITGSTMKLKVILTETKEVVGEYTLTRDKEPTIRKCR